MLSLKPNAAHLELANWQSRFRDFQISHSEYRRLTSTGWFREVIEFHGSIWSVRCTTCHSRQEIIREGERADACLSCGDPVRPDVVLFGEMLPAGAFETAAEAAASCEFCFVIGTSALVYPAAALPEIARAAGAFVCEVNPERTQLSNSVTKF